MYSDRGDLPCDLDALRSSLSLECLPRAQKRALDSRYRSEHLCEGFGCPESHHSHTQQSVSWSQIIIPSPSSEPAHDSEPSDSDVSHVWVVSHYHVGIEEGSR